MYITVHDRGTDYEHLHVTVERGFASGTWEVRYEPGAPGWRVRSPRGRETRLDARGAWIGDAGRELQDVLSRIAKRAVIEIRNREMGALASAPAAEGGTLGETEATDPRAA